MEIDSIIKALDDACDEDLGVLNIEKHEHEIRISGDKRGLMYFAACILRVASNDSVGAHGHLDPVTVPGVVDVTLVVARLGYTRHTASATSTKASLC
jgi:hypothetical protein